MEFRYRAFLLLLLLLGLSSGCLGAIECSSNGTDLTEGDLVMVTCAYGTAAIEFVTLSIGDRDIGASLTWKDDVITAVAYYSVVAADDDSPFVCAIESESICETPPVNVRYRPIVELLPPAQKVYYPFEAVFLCQVSANPADSLLYQWFVDGVKLPATAYSRFKVESEDNSKLTIEETESGDVDRTIECNVTNEIGSGTGQAVVELEDVMIIVIPLIVGLVLLIIIFIVASVLCYRRNGRCCQCGGKGATESFEDYTDDKYIGRAKTTRERTKVKHMRKYQDNDYNLNYDSSLENGHISSSPTNLLGLGLADSYEHAGSVAGSSRLGVEMADVGIKSVSSIEDNEEIELISTFSEGNQIFEDRYSTLPPRINGANGTGPPRSRASSSRAAPEETDQVASGYTRAVIENTDLVQETTFSGNTPTLDSPSPTLVENTDPVPVTSLSTPTHSSVHSSGGGDGGTRNNLMPEQDESARGGNTESKAPDETGKPANTPIYATVDWNKKKTPKTADKN